MPDIYKLWILHNPSGISLFEQTFEELDGETDSCVVAGFLFAIANITENITGEKIEFVQMNNLRFSYNLNPQYLLILVCTKESKQSRIIQIVQQIKHKFEKKYLSTITPVFSGNVSEFKEFAKEVESIVNHDTKYFQFIDRRNEQLKEMFQTQANEWLSMKKSLEKKASSFGAWIVKENPEIDQTLSAKITESREKSRELDAKKKSDESKSSWI